MKRKLTLVMGLVAAAALPSFATVYFFTGAKGSSWQDTNNYRLDSRTGTVPSVLPGADDYVIVGAVNSLSTNDVEITAADMSFIAGLKGIGVRNAILTLNVATDVHLGCAIAGFDDSASSVGRHGEVIKKGAGSLYLDSCGTVFGSGTSVPADYLSYRFTVKEGVVYAMNVTASYSSGFLGVVKVEDGATFHLPTYTTSTFHLEGFEGDGDISYAGPLTKLQLYFDGNIKGPHVFNGTLSGNVKVFVQGGISQVFGGVSTFNANDDVTVTAGASETTTLGFSVGNASRTAAQSLGTYGQMKFNQPSGEYAPRLLYTGTGGDTFAKKIVCLSGNAGIIDGGDFGGLTIAGSSGGVLRYSNSSSNPGVARLVFQGDGATENAYDTVLDNRVNQSERGTATAQPMTIVKKGAGIWKFTARTDHYETGTYAIDEGTLRFGSLAPVGTSCSLGLGTMTYDPDYSYKGALSGVDTTKQVGYHIRLGGGSTAGTLEYVGTTDVSNDSRIIAVNGNGTLKNSSGHSFSQYGVVTSGAGAHTLTLDGVAEAGNITNTVGTLSVAVDAGEGTTRLSRNLSFNGALSVSGGHLKIHNPTNYTYFKFTVKENMYDIYGVTASYDNKVCMSEFAMYDGEGKNLTTNLTVVSAAVAGLGENEACYVQGSDSSASYPLSALFNDVGEPLADGDWRGKSPAASFNPADSSTWLIFAIRLPESSPRVAAFDFISALKGPSTKGGDPKTDAGVHSMYDLAPRAYVLEGSLDGVTWHELYSESDHNANHIYYKTYGDNAQIFWASSDGTEAFASGAVRSGVGFAFTSPAAAPSEYGTALRNISGVSVDAGATLKYVGDVAPVAKITIDVAAGVGILDNVTLAGSGTVDFVNVPEGDVEIAVDWSRVNNPSALNGWPLTIDGEVPQKRVIARTDSGFKILRRGFIMTFR